MYTGMPLEKVLLVASVFPVCFQWSSSGFPVVLKCVPIMQIDTGSPLEHHWVLASANVVPVASQCTCGSSGLPVWSVQWYPSVLTESGLEVIRSGHFPACDHLCIQLVRWVVWTQLIPCDFQPQIHNKRPVGLYSSLLIQIFQYCNKCLHVNASKTGWTPNKKGNQRYTFNAVCPTYSLTVLSKRPFSLKQEARQPN